MYFISYQAARPMEYILYMVPGALNNQVKDLAVDSKKAVFYKTTATSQLPC